jgi:hypothetical protein
VTVFPRYLSLPSTHSPIPLQKVTTGPLSCLLLSAASFALRSSSRCFSASSQRFKLFALRFSTMAASASRSACVMGGFFIASILLALRSMASISFRRFASLSTICWCNASLLSMVVSRFEALVGMSAIVGSQLALSDFFFGLGAGVAEEESGVAVGSTLTFFLNFTGIASWALRLRAASFFSRACFSNSFSPSSSSPCAWASSSSDDESICASESPSSTSSKPASSASSAKSSSSSSSGSSAASMDFMRFPAVERLDRLVASHSTCGASSCVSSLSEASELLLLLVGDSFLSSSWSSAMRCSSPSAAIAKPVDALRGPKDRS